MGRSGTGLGLAISRKFLRLMEGDLTVSTEEGKGSVFHLEMWVAPGAEREVKAELGTVCRVWRLLPNSPSRRILVVDDHRDNRELLQYLLEPIGFEVRTAEDGAQAVARCAEWAPHLVVLDLRMPVMDGYEAARRLRAAHGSAIKILALSAGVFAENQQEALAAGADTFLGKPFREEDLLEQVKELLAIDYVYDDLVTEPTTEATEAAPFTAELRQLPVEWVAQLREAICRADYDRMLDLVEQVAACHEALADWLRQLVERFDYATLQTVLTNEATPQAKDQTNPS